MTTAQRHERFVLKQHRGWFVIYRQHADYDFTPPFWVDDGEIARFRTREAARRFMLAGGATA